MKGIFTILVVLLVVSLAGIAFWLLQQNQTAAPSGSGTIETDEVHVASRYGGRVAKILAQEGDSLKAGQVLVELEAGELQARRDQAAAMLAESEAGPRKEEIAAAKNDWESLQAELEFALADEKRTRELFEKNTVSTSERDRAVTKARGLEKSVAAAKSRYELLLAGTRPERIDQARAQLSEIDAQLREMKILAPTNSVLEVLSVKTGDVLPANREVATLLHATRWVRVFVPEPWLGNPSRSGGSRAGRSFRTRTSRAKSSRSAALPSSHLATPKLWRNGQTGVRRRKIRLVNDGDLLWAGMCRRCPSRTFRQSK